MNDNTILALLSDYGFTLFQDFINPPQIRRILVVYKNDRRKYKRVLAKRAIVSLVNHCSMCLCVWAEKQSLK